MLVDFRKGLGGESYYPYLGLVDLGATYDFIFQSVADKLKLEAAKAGRKKIRKKMPLPISTINGESLCTTQVIR